MSALQAPLSSSGCSQLRSPFPVGTAVDGDQVGLLGLQSLESELSDNLELYEMSKEEGDEGKHDAHH